MWMSNVNQIKTEQMKEKNKTEQMKKKLKPHTQ